MFLRLFRRFIEVRLYYFGSGLFELHEIGRLKIGNLNEKNTVSSVPDQYHLPGVACAKSQKESIRITYVIYSSIKTNDGGKSALVG